MARQRVRVISASTVRSTRQLIAAAAPATSAMPSEAARNSLNGGKPGEARNMPIIAVNTIRVLTRGLHSAKKSARRCPKWRGTMFAIVWLVSLT